MLYVRMYGFIFSPLLGYVCYPAYSNPYFLLPACLAITTTIYTAFGLYGEDADVLLNGVAHTVSVPPNKLECGPMPNVMVALPIIGGALCSTPQSLADAHY